MKSHKLLESFKDKKFRYGGYAALVSALAITLVVAVNLMVEKIPASVDLTRQKLFSISAQTLEILKGLEEKVTIYGLYETGKEPEFVAEILEKYQNASAKVNVEYVDPYRNPGFLNKYENEDNPPGENSLIIELGNSFKTISHFELFNYSPPSAENPLAARRALSFKAEEKITGTILALTGAANPTVYVLQGHLEEPFPHEMRRQLERENYSIKELNLLTEDAVPQDADILLMIGPGKDLSDQEEKKIREFLFERRGHVLFLIDIIAKDSKLTNIEGLLRSYGVEMQPALILEQDPEYHLPQFPIGLIPSIQIHSITAGLISSGLAVLFPRTQAIKTLEVKRRTVQVEPLLVSSAISWGKVDLDDLSLEPSPQDLQGPFNLAVAITDKGEGDTREARAVVTASSFFLYPERAIGVPLKGPGNADFLYNALDWLYGRRQLLSIRAKSLTQFPLRMNQLQFYLFAGISIILIPLLVFAAGLVVWLRRRHL